MYLEYNNDTHVVYVKHPQIQPYRVSWFGIGHIVELIKRDENFASRVAEALQDPMGELVAVSEEAGLYDDPCPDCGGKTHVVVRGSATPCPSCGDSGTCPTVNPVRVTCEVSGNCSCHVDAASKNYDPNGCCMGCGCGTRPDLPPCQSCWNQHRPHDVHCEHRPARPTVTDAAKEQT